MAAGEAVGRGVGLEVDLVAMGVGAFFFLNERVDVDAFAFALDPEDFLDALEAARDPSASYLCLSLSGSKSLR